ncbi:MAG: cyclic nucleotide-binding domain-containing protein [Actinomycetota bacterium]
MELDTALINLAYVIYVASALVRSLVPLRLTLLAASCAFIAYGIAGDEPSVVLWNVAFGVFSIWELIRIRREQRPVLMEEDQRAAYDAVFHQLSEQDFDRLWRSSTHERHGQEVTLTHQGIEVHDLMLVTGGTATVHIDGRMVATIGRHMFVGEMTLVSGGPASATVITNQGTEIRRWSHGALDGIQEAKPELATRLWQILSRDLSLKMNRA